MSGILWRYFKRAIRFMQFKSEEAILVRHDWHRLVKKKCQSFGKQVSIRNVASQMALLPWPNKALRPHFAADEMDGMQFRGMV